MLENIADIRRQYFGYVSSKESKYDEKYPTRWCSGADWARNGYSTAEF
jgi:hypothetical protein